MELSSLKNKKSQKLTFRAQKVNFLYFGKWNFLPPILKKGVTPGNPDLSKIFKGKVTKLTFLLRVFPITNHSLKVIYSFL